MFVLSTVILLLQDLKSGKEIDVRKSAACCIVTNGKLLVGYRDGMVEAHGLCSQMLTCRVSPCCLSSDYLRMQKIDCS